MLVTWRYRELKDSIIQGFDPRAWFTFFACFLVSTLMFWDPRYLLVFFLAALFFIFSSGVTWRESRRAWLFIGGFILLFTTLTFLTGKGGVEVYTEEHVLTTLKAPFSFRARWA